MEQFGYRDANYTERGVKIITGMGVFAPIFLLLDVLQSITTGEKSSMN